VKPVGELPAISAFSQGVSNAIAMLEKALSEEDVTDAANATSWLLDDVEEMRNRLIDLMQERDSTVPPYISGDLPPFGEESCL
jgi:hypothetical protein